MPAFVPAMEEFVFDSLRAGLNDTIFVDDPGIPGSMMLLGLGILEFCQKVTKFDSTGTKSPGGIFE